MHKQLVSVVVTMPTPEISQEGLGRLLRITFLGYTFAAKAYYNLFVESDSTSDGSCQTNKTSKLIITEKNKKIMFSFL